MQKINCTVNDCKHCDTTCNCCCLKEINVCNCGTKEQKQDTMCNNYDKRQ